MKQWLVTVEGRRASLKVWFSKDATEGSWPCMRKRTNGESVACRIDRTLVHLFPGEQKLAKCPELRIAPTEVRDLQHTWVKPSHGDR